MNQILPTQTNVRRHTAMLFAGVTSLTLAGLIAFLSIKPVAYLGIRGNSGVVDPQISQLVASCQFGYVGCHDPKSIYATMQLNQKSVVQLDAIAQQADINPAILVSLVEVITNQPYEGNLENLDMTRQLATEIRQEYATQTAHTTIYHHALYGSFVFNDANRESVVLTHILAQHTTSKPQFLRALEIDSVSSDEFASFPDVFKHHTSAE